MKFLSMIILLSISMVICAQNKIVGLVQIRNEQDLIEQCLRALALYADGIVVLDDASEDNTVKIVQNLAQELPIEKIIMNDTSAWQTGLETENREKLLQAGRAIGGTHFILIDADEIFSAQCMEDNWLRNKILSLVPGEVLRMPTVNFWNGIRKFRNDKKCNPFQTRWLKPIAFCDDGMCNYNNNYSVLGQSKVLHAYRFPTNLTHLKFIYHKDLQHVLCHFKFANLENIEIKKCWYMCLELIRSNQKNNNPMENAKNINKQYNIHEFKCQIKSGMRLKHANPYWLSYDFINPEALTAVNTYQKNEINKWFTEYGMYYFKNLHFSYVNLRNILSIYK